VPAAKGEPTVPHGGARGNAPPASSCVICASLDKADAVDLRHRMRPVPLDGPATGAPKADGRPWAATGLSGNPGRL